MVHDQQDRLTTADRPDTVAMDADTAVRHALVEGRRHILNFLHRRLGDPGAAEDVLQAFMLRAISRSGQLRDVRAVRGWLSQILASSIADYGRQMSRQRRREVVMAPADLDGTQDEVDEELDEAVCRCLYELLPTLKPEYAELIWRVDLQEQPRAAVAKNLAITLNNLNVRLHRGRLALKARLEQMCLTCPVHGFLDCDCSATNTARARLQALGDPSRTRTEE